jgi:hypothetical protein
MATISSTYQINGIIDTNQSVYKNIQSLATASGCWFTFDIQTGLWSVVINTTGASVASFTDSNIIGNLNVTGKGIRELYNRVVVEFPHEELLNENDFTEYEIPAGDMFPNEMPNTLNFKMDLVSKPEHAQRLALQELKQSRVDKVIQFRTDFSELGLKAGDIIDVTSTMYDFSAKLFRITEITEEDGDDNNIVLGITALEYDATVYDYTDVFRDSRERANGIVVKTINTATKDEDDKSTSKQIERLLISSAVTGLINAAFSRNPITGKITQALTNKAAGQAAQDAFSDTTRADVLKKIKPPPVTITGPDSICEGETLTLVVALDDPNCSCLLDTTTYQFPYAITGTVALADLTSFPLTGTTLIGNVNIPIATDAVSDDNETLTFTIQGVSKTVTVREKQNYTIAITATSSPVTEGNSTTLNIATTNIANGTVIPYTISGAATGKVTTSLTGNVTISSNAASLAVNTTNTTYYDGDLDFTFTLTTSGLGTGGAFCGSMGNSSLTVTVKDTFIIATDCPTVSIPLTWCGKYDSSGKLVHTTPSSYITVPAAQSGSGSTTTVPLTVRVTPGSPSTIAVLTTASIDTTAGKGGAQATIITTFNSIGSNAPVTGSATTTVYGYL